MSLFSMFNRRSSLNALSDLDDKRLSDLGLNRYDLHDAKRLSAVNASFLLASRREERAEYWLR